METKGVGCGRDACISCSVCYSILRAFPICTHRCMQTLIGKTSLRLKKYHMVLISIRCNRSLQYFRFINGSRRSSSHQLHSFGVLHTFQSASAGNAGHTSTVPEQVLLEAGAMLRLRMEIAAAVKALWRRQSAIDRVR